MRICFTLLSLFFSFFITHGAIANIECGKESIGKNVDSTFDESYTEDKIRNLCGHPTKIKKWAEEVLNKYQDGYVKTTQHYSMWTYNRGSNTFVEYLMFKDGILVDIKDGDYGSD